MKRKGSERKRPRPTLRC